MKMRLIGLFGEAHVLTGIFCRTFKDNQARLQLFTLAYHRDNFLWQLTLHKPVRNWSLTTPRVS